MSTDYNVGNKTTFCRVIYGKHLNTIGYNITNIHHECRYGSTCNGCHNPSEFKLLSHIPRWEKKNKSHINLLEIKESIIDSFTKELHKIKNIKYRSSIMHARSLSFNELLHYWFDITCYHRKIAKTLKSKSECEGYSNKKDVPKFFLQDEDNVWALERVLHYCPKFKIMTQNKGNTTNIRDICIGHRNCKMGVHDYKDIVCIDDLIHGKCSCGPDTYNDSKTHILCEIQKLKSKLVNKVDSDGFQVQISKLLKTKITSDILILEKQLSTLKPRMIHYTEQGIIPLSQRIKEKELSRPKDINCEKIKTKTTRRVMKKKK